MNHFLAIENKAQFGVRCTIFIFSSTFFSRPTKSISEVIKSREQTWVCAHIGIGIIRHLCVQLCLDVILSKVLFALSEAIMNIGYSFFSILCRLSACFSQSFKFVFSYTVCYCYIFSDLQYMISSRTNIQLLTKTKWV